MFLDMNKNKQRLISDYITFILILIVMLISSHRLKVYYQIVPTRISLTAISLDDRKSKPITLPSELRGTHSGINRTKRKIINFLKTDEGIKLKSSWGKLEWRIRYSVNSLNFDKVKIFYTVGNI